MIDLGFDGNLASVAAGAGALTKWVLYPLAQLRRRVDSDGDGQPDDVARGTYYLHPDLQGVAVLAALAVLGGGAALATGSPLFPMLSASFTGWATARAAHEGLQAVKR